MQFRLGTLLCLVTLVAVFCGLVFAAPLIVTAIVLCATMWLSPTVWISGASYASGGKQAFFRGPCWLQACVLSCRPGHCAARGIPATSA